jgi:hypothetical protein
MMQSLSHQVLILTKFLIDDHRLLAEQLCAILDTSLELRVFPTKALDLFLQSGVLGLLYFLKSPQCLPRITKGLASHSLTRTRGRNSTAHACYQTRCEGREASYELQRPECLGTGALYRRQR